jgi:hypothetical protein
MGKKTVEISQLLPSHTYELRVKSQDPPQFVRRSDRKYVTLITELGKHERVAVKDGDSEGREVKWTDLKGGDIVTVERSTDAAVYIKTEKDKESFELKYLQSDPTSAGKMAQQLWPGLSLLRKFERATPSSWTTYETLWTEPRDQWHRWMRFNGRQREITFISEEQFFRQAENWVNGTVNITDDVETKYSYRTRGMTSAIYWLSQTMTKSFRLDGMV